MENQKATTISVSAATKTALVEEKNRLSMAGGTYKHLSWDDFLRLLVARKI